MTIPEVVMSRVIIAIVTAMILLPIEYKQPRVVKPECIEICNSTFYSSSQWEERLECIKLFCKDIGAWN